MESDDPLERMAADHVLDKACETYGIARHFAAGGGEMEDEREAMWHALARVAPMVTAAALHQVAGDTALGLSVEQKLRLDELAVDLDLDVAEILSGALGLPGREEERSQRYQHPPVG